MANLEITVRFPLTPEQSNVLSLVEDSFTENEWKEIATEGLIAAVRREANIEVINTRIVSDDPGIIMPENPMEEEIWKGYKNAEVG